MNQCKIHGRVHSFQSLGTVDGPGVRSVVFMQGCPLRCSCCHNPDTWDFEAGEEKTPAELIEKIKRCRGYYGSDGGVTVSGGEPLAQAKFVEELFSELKEIGIHTALDTSGCYLNEQTKKLLNVTDLVLLDFKYTNAQDYLAHTKMEMSKAEEFLKYLNSINKPTWLRYVLIPGINDSESDLAPLFEKQSQYPCIERIELLPFRKLCLEKYETLGIPFPLQNTPEATQKQADELAKKFATPKA